jgi:hypothetical protein
MKNDEYKVDRDIKRLNYLTRNSRGSEFAPIALFTYNRLDHTRRTIEALKENVHASDSHIYIYSDAAKTTESMQKVFEVRQYLRQLKGFKSITLIERETNLGVDNSIIDGVTFLCDCHDRVIVVEDDLVTSKWFLKYMNTALNLYRAEPAVMQVSGFMFPISGFSDNRASFLPYATSWGWATWKRAWDEFDITAAGFSRLRYDRNIRDEFDLGGAYDHYEMLCAYVNGKLDAWDIRWYLTVFNKNGLTLFPQKSLVHNIGFDGSGVHCPASDFPGGEISDAEIVLFPKVEINTDMWSSLKSYLHQKKDMRISAKIRRLFTRLLK